MKRLFLVAGILAILITAGISGIDSSKALAAPSVSGVDARAMIGMSEAALKSAYGGASRTEPSEYGFTWHIYSRDYKNYFMAGIRGGKVVAVYTTAATLRYGDDFARNSSKSSVRARLGSPLSYVRAGNTVAVLPNAGQKDMFAAGDNYVIAFYDVIAGGAVTSVMVIPQADEIRALTSKQELSSSLTAAYQRISVDLINAARALRGLKTLAMDTLDTKLAVSRSADMVSRNYFNHYTPEKKSPADLAKNMGLRFTSLGENIAYGNNNAMLAHESFMNSSEHRSNVLKSAYTKVGAGAVYGGSRYVILTNIFSNNTAEPPQPPVSGIAVSSGRLSPSFSTAAKSYTVELPATVSQLTVTPVKNKANNKYTYINGKKTASAKLTPPIGGASTATIVAVSADGRTKESYTITARRAALVTNIAVSAGALAFKPATMSYTVSVPADTPSITITPVAAATGVKSMSVSASTLKPAVGGSATARIVATAADGRTTTTYTVTVKRAPVISGISVSGGSLSSAFSSANGSYRVNLPATASTVKLTPVKGAGCTSLTINGAATASITVKPAVGQSIPVTIKGSTAKGTAAAYTVTVYRAPLVTNIYSGTKGVSLGFAFNPANLNYTVRLPANVSSVVIKATKAKSGVKSMTFNGKKAASFTAKPAIGGSVAVRVAATAKNGAAVTYTVTVTRAALVTNMTVSAGALAFKPATMSYTVSVPADTSSVTVTPVAAATGVKSMSVSASTLKPAVGGSATAKIIATAADGKTKSTYTVTVKRAPVISGISVSGGSLSSAFSAANGSYRVNLPATASTVKLTPVKAAGCTSLTINGAAASSITVKPAVGQSVPVTIKGSTAKGTTATYTVIVSRAALITNIYSGTKGVSLGAFNTANLNYTVKLPANVSSVVIKAAKAKSGVKSLTFNGKKATSFTAKPVIGGSVAVKVAATAKNGATVTYTVTVTRSAPLANIKASAGTMSPAFSAGVTSYDVYLPAAADSVTITPTANATCIVTNDVDKSHAWAKLSPAPGGTAAVNFTASASDRSNSAKYRVTVHREALLKGISAGGAALSPAFNVSVKAYTVNIGANDPGVTITPSANPGCTYTIDGLPGNTPATLSPAPGESAVTSIKVKTAAGTAQMTYTVTVKRSPLLSGIDLSAGTLKPSFSAGKHEYTVRVPADVSAVTVTPDVTAGCSYSINGGDQNAPLELPIPAGGSATAKITVSAGGAAAEETYTVTINRDAALSGITAMDGEDELELVPVLPKTNPPAYSVAAPFHDGAAATIKLTATPASDSTKVSYTDEDGKEIDAESIVKPEDSAQLLIYIVCTPDNGLPPAVFHVLITWAEAGEAVEP